MCVRVCECEHYIGVVLAAMLVVKSMLANFLITGPSRLRMEAQRRA